MDDCKLYLMGSRPAGIPRIYDGLLISPVEDMSNAGAFLYNTELFAPGCAGSSSAIAARAIASHKISSITFDLPEAASLSSKNKVRLASNIPPWSLVIVRSSSQQESVRS
jgi:hypothetical protein